MRAPLGPAEQRQTIKLPHAPALVSAPGRAVWLDVSGEIEHLAAAEITARLGDETPPFVCHAKATARRLGLKSFFAYDLLELFAFVYPARFCLPTPKGLAAALGLDAPGNHEDEALALIEAARRLLAVLAADDLTGGEDAAPIAFAMARAGWVWGEAVQAALAAGGRRPALEGDAAGGHAGALAAWTRLKEWQESAPEPPAGHLGVSAAEARARLTQLLGESAEPRPEQADYASAVSRAFQPAEAPEEPHVVLAEAGTGVGKTLGYIAPVSVWAEKNDGTVWLSTFTRNLQRQIDQELDRLYPEPKVKADKVVVRKGRENYLCLLNMEEAVGRSALVPSDRIAMGLLARWVGASRDGDMVGGDFPAWLADLLGYGRTLGLTDRRGECIYSGCAHYRKCFIEKSQRKARKAEIVIANHALVMVQAARDAFAGGEERGTPTRFVFDEGHHVFDAADSAFSSHLTGGEARELRRWLLGPERRGRRGASGRARGLKSRIEDLIAERPPAQEALDEALKAARILPADEWHQRIATGAPHGPAEAFLAAVRQQVLARAADRDSPYGLETPCAPTIEGLVADALTLDQALGEIGRPLLKLSRHLAAMLDEEAAALDTQARNRIEGVLRGIARRVEEQLAAWRSMLQSLSLHPAAANDDEAEDGAPAGAPEGFVDWFALDRFDGRDIDVGMHRHHVDPTVPFAEFVIGSAHGALITSATLRDGTGDVETDWGAAEARTGARHLSKPALRAEVPSPFDYAAQTRVYIVTDVAKGNADRVATAYRELMLAAGGGALGLFTAIARLRAVYGRIAAPLDDAGLSLWAQHVDALDTSTLVDIFRADENSCLLGTDAVRDGVDVPGASLRLIVFDRVPWPRPNILHKARKRAFGGSRYDDMLTRLKLKQAYGRLVRRASDRGVFVLLDGALPSRLLGAFPRGVAVERVGLKQAIEGVRGFLHSA